LLTVSRSFGYRKRDALVNGLYIAEGSEAADWAVQLSSYEVAARLSSVAVTDVEVAGSLGTVSFCDASRAGEFRDDGF
jgi:hypothetical protein